VQSAVAGSLPYVVKKERINKKEPEIALSKVRDGSATSSVLLTYFHYVYQKGWRNYVNTVILRLSVGLRKGCGLTSAKN